MNDTQGIINITSQNEKNAIDNSAIISDVKENLQRNLITEKEERINMIEKCGQKANEDIKNLTQDLEQLNLRLLKEQNNNDFMNYNTIICNQVNNHQNMKEIHFSTCKIPFHFIKYFQ